MMRKRVAILFIFIASSILLLHSIVPHHHHEETDHIVNTIDDQDHDHDHDTDQDFLGSAFSHLQHDQDLLYTSEEQTCKQIADHNLFISVLNSPPGYNIYPAVFLRKHEFFSVNESPPNAAVDQRFYLRGPPAFL